MRVKLLRIIFSSFFVIIHANILNLIIRTFICSFNDILGFDITCLSIFIHLVQCALNVFVEGLDPDPILGYACGDIKL